MSQKVWLVTGCSSGFGEQFIKSILQRGDKAMATARQLGDIAHLCDLGAAIFQLDMTASQQELDSIVKQAWDVYGNIDILVQNAGYGYVAAVEDLGFVERWNRRNDGPVTDCDELERNYRTNVFGVVNLTRSVTPYFRQQQSGFVLLISSGASSLVFPGFGGYGSSKAAVEYLIRVYAEEVKEFVKVLILCPGTYRTSIRDMSKHAKDKLPASSEHYQGMIDTYRNILETTHGTQNGDPEKFVNLAMDLVKGEGIGQGKEIPQTLPVGADCIPGVKAKLERDLDNLKEWEDVLIRTDYDVKVQPKGDALFKMAAS